MDFLVRIEIAEPPADQRAELIKQEAARAVELAEQGHVHKLWRVQGRWANAGLWSAQDSDELMHLLDSLPLRPWMTISVDAVEHHPSDPSAG